MIKFRRERDGRQLEQFIIKENAKKTGLKDYCFNPDGSTFLHFYKVGNTLFVQRNQLIMCLSLFGILRFSVLKSICKSLLASINRGINTEFIPFLCLSPSQPYLCEQNKI